MQRCGWAGTDPTYVAYHDTEWGVPTRDPRRLFEFVVLEGAQAGLSWSTILNKRDGYRRLFADFDPEIVAQYGPADVERCLADPGIVRNRQKVESAVTNARRWLELDDPAAFIWSFVDGAPIQHRFAALADVPAVDERSQRMSAELRRRGFKFVGPTICYAFMQACGLVNDHILTCFRHAECAAFA